MNILDFRIANVYAGFEGSAKVFGGGTQILYISIICKII
jgi:hypothetical protein